ncbi:hypothetical protein DIZ45_15120 [Acinetobacter junii]|nr:hypothetical protein DIZ45_15120 [Acinetobacter junii]
MRKSYKLSIIFLYLKEYLFLIVLLLNLFIKAIVIIVRFIKLIQIKKPPDGGFFNLKSTITLHDS